MPDSTADGSRSLVVGAFRRAFARTESRLLKTYVLVSALLGALLAVLLLLAFPVWVFETAGGSELATFSRAFLIVVGVLLLVTLVAPVLSAGRRHARGTASARGDLSLALAGYLFIGSLYASLLVSAPPAQRETPPALLAPAVEFLYSLPAAYAVAPPLVAAALILLVHRFAR
ncbi:hypothetical protein M0R89_04180 [Halorussus limi]|uniref:DUF8056 domain-containing protein n=1 Tax=Halorussus limi TaxID=2938695 RepID=A0A8U0HWQ8_9EURY|nr:hypothetical protein [Halorussus limi]UPV75269.1 hypothetical protein M0R89_04180 [Halorussus limi]